MKLKDLIERVRDRLSPARPAAAGNITDVSAAEGSRGRVLPLRLPKPAPDSKPEDRIAQMLGSILETLRSTVRFTSANVFLLENGSLVQRAYTTKSKALARLATVRPDQGFFAHVMKSGRPFFLNNLRKEGRSLGYYALPGEKVGSFAAIPIRCGGDEVAGLLALDDSDENAFPPETEAILVAIANLLGRVLESEGRAQEADESIRKSRLSRTVAEAAALGKNFEEAAESVARTALDETGAFSAALFLRDEEGDLHLSGGVGYHDLFARNVKRRAALFVADHALRQGSPFRLDGAALAARYREAMPGQAPVVQLAIPLHYKGEGIGALVLDFASERDVPEGVDATLAAAASEVASHLVRIYRAGLDRKRAETTTGDLDSALELLGCPDPEAFWGGYFAVTATALPSARGFAAYQLEGDSFVPVAAKDFDPGVESFAKGQGLVGWTALAARAVRVRRSDRKDLTGWIGNAFLSFPVIVAEKVQVVVVAAYDAGAVSEEDLDETKRLGRLASASLPTVLRVAEAEARVAKDLATGLWNRQAFEARAGAVLAHRAAALLFLDATGCEEIERFAGHAETERLVARAGRIAARCAPANAVVGRVGEREFAVLLPTIKPPEIEAAATRIAETVAAARIGTDVRGTGFGISFAIGRAATDRAPSSYGPLYAAAEASARGVTAARIEVQGSLGNIVSLRPR